MKSNLPTPQNNLTHQEALERIAYLESVIIRLKERINSIAHFKLWN